MQTTYQNNTQRQISQSTDLMRSFKTSTNLAAGLTKERVTIQNELQKIGQTKSLLEEMRVASKSKKAEPILTVEEKASKVNKAEIKGTGFQMKMVSSLKGADMIEAQRDSRRQRHIACLQECEKFTDQFYDNFSEKKNEIKERIKVFRERSDVEIDHLMSGLSDELLLANEIGYVNGVWEKVNSQRSQRKSEVQALRNGLDDLRAFQEKGSGSYLGGMRSKLIEIAFYLEPQVDDLMKQQITDENAKYAAEHEECDVFYEEIVVQEETKFDALYQIWKESVVRFHKIKQDDAIKRFVDRLNSKEFVNPQTRVDIFQNMKEEQSQLYKQRVQLVDTLNETHPKQMTKELVSGIADQLATFNEESSVVFDSLVGQLTKDMENTNEDIDIALYDLKDFIVKNDAELEEGQTFDLIVENRAKPYVERRKLESKTLIMNSIAYQEDFDYKMSEMTQNIVNFFKEFATCLDKNKDKLKQTEINFQVALANCGDHHDDIIQNQEDELKKKVTEMERAIHHVMLNEKLQECFNLLDQIQRTYRNYNDEYIKILHNYPNQMDTFFEEFEQGSLGVFKRFPEEQRERIQELFEKETADAQAKLEADALRKWEEEKRAEESKLEAEAKKAAADPKAKKAAPAKGGKGKDADKPNLDVETLAVPEIFPYESKMGQKYLIERSLPDITDKLMKPAPTEEEQNQQDADGANEGAAQDGTESPELSAVDRASKADLRAGKESKVEGAEGEAEEEEEEVKEEEQPVVVENDHMEKAEMSPPKDPEGIDCLVPDLILSAERIMQILEKALDVTMDWLIEEKKVYNAKCVAEGKTLQDQSVEELDENLREQWPRKGKLEVEVFQERKSQVTNHNRKYERQVRTCLDKYQALEEEWGLVLSNIQEEFDKFQATVNRLKDNLPQGKNLAQLQGTSRREKDAAQQFEERCRELKEKLDDLSFLQPDLLIENNNGMLKSCQLFENGGNYDGAEIQWYQTQMDEINEMITTCKTKRLGEVEDLIVEMKRLGVEPEEEFTGEYKNSIEELSAKDGLGKTYGQPRRFAQERLRSEMTKCEEAQKGVDKILEKLNGLMAKAFNEYGRDFDYAKEKTSLSIEIRVNLVSVVRMMIHYGKHLGGFKPGDDPEDLPRISYLEDQEEVALQESEVEIDATRMADELEHLGPIGFSNANEEYFKFPDAIMNIDKTCKDLVTKLYTGDNAKHLVGDEKIPEYLTRFLANMHRQVEEFKINCVRQLRMASEKLVEICQQVPRSVFFFLQFKYESMTLNQVDTCSANFEQKQREDKTAKDEHLRLFRPNLENPANKEMTKELNDQEIKRSEAMKDLIDETQMDLLMIEEGNSGKYYTAYLNNLRALISVFDKLIPASAFIMLPGDEIVEKKHGNIKTLTAQMESADLSKRVTRKWPGLGDNVFKIDYAELLGEAKAEGEEAAAEEKPTNEIIGEIEVKNTPQHKQIIKARDEYYQVYKQRFEASITQIMGSYDELRKEENRFTAYWNQNLEEITKKHI